MKLQVASDGRRLVAHVRLSERNLRALLFKVTQPESARILVSEQADGTLLVVHAESNEEHYAGRPTSPGPLQSDAEAHLREERSDDVS